MAVTREQVAELYVAYFNRAPDAAGLDYWVNDSFGGVATIEQISESFFYQVETQAKYPNTLTDAEFINTIYNNLFNRDAEPAGLEYWVNELENGTITRANMILAVVNGAVDSGLGSDATILENKTEIALAFADAGLNLVEDAKLVMDEVDHTQTSVDDALAEIAVLVAEAANVGETFALTTSATDTILGTTFNDTILGQVTDSDQPTAANTLHASDVIDGNDGVDTLIVTADGDYPEVTGFSMTNVENLEIRSYGDDVTLGLVNVQGLEKVITETSTGDIYLQDVMNMVDLELTGSGTDDRIYVEVEYAQEATVGDTTQNVLVDRFEGELGIYGNGEDSVENVHITTVNRATEGMDLYGEDIQNVVVDGDVALEIWVESLLTTFDASELDAELDAYLSMGDESTVTGTAYSDDIYVNAIGNNVTVDAGEGDNYVNVYRDYYYASNEQITVNAGSGDDSIYVYGDSYYGYGLEGSAVTIDAGDGDNYVNVGEDASAIDVTTGDGADSIYLDTVSDNSETDYAVGSVTVSSGAADDVIVLGYNGLEGVSNNTAMGYTINGGQGNDTLVVDSLYDVDAAGTFANVSNVETLEVTEYWYEGSLDGVTTGANEAGITTYDFTGFTLNDDLTLSNVANEVNVNLDLEVDYDYFSNITLTQVGTGAVANLELALSNEYDSMYNTYDLNELNVDTTETLNIDLVNATPEIFDGEAGVYVPNTSDNMYIDNLNSLGDMVPGALTTLNIEGDLNLQVWNIDAGNLAAINAATMTKDLLVELDDVAAAITVNTGAGDDTIFGEDSTTAYTVNSNDGDDYITTNDLADTVNAGAGEDYIITYAGNDVINAGEGNDYIEAGTGIETIDAGAGDDFIDFEDVALTSADTIDGGDGIDTVSIYGLGGFDRNDDFFYKWSNVEILNLDTNGASTLELNSIANDSGLETVILNGPGHDTITVGEGFVRDLTVVLNGDDTGYSTVDASASAIALTVSGDATHFDANDELYGGTGAGDILEVVADDTIATFGPLVNGFETLNVVRPADALATNIFSVEVVTDDDMVAAGQTLDVNVMLSGYNAELEDGDVFTFNEGDTFVFNGSDELDGMYNIDSSAAYNIINAGQSDDTITVSGEINQLLGEDGNDTITSTGTGINIMIGGDGNDTMTAENAVTNVDLGFASIMYGGAGADTMTGSDTGVDQYYYEMNTDSSGVNVDTITNFISGQDTIDLSQVLADTMLAGTITFVGNFANITVAETALVAGDGNLNAIFVEADNMLYVDYDNSGEIDAGDMAIELSGVTGLTQDDFAAIMIA